MYEEKKHCDLSEKGGLRRYKLVIIYDTKNETVELIEEDITEEDYGNIMPEDYELNYDEEEILDMMQKKLEPGRS
jgi:hypothetical protein